MVDHQQSTREARRFIAEHDYSEGDVILEEEPVVSAQFAWNRLCKYKACDQCLKSLEGSQEMGDRLSGRTFEYPHEELLVAPIVPHPCRASTSSDDASSDPSQIACDHTYCSEECRELAFKRHHNILCTATMPPEARTILLSLDEMWREYHPPPETSSLALILRIFAQTMNGDEATLELLRTLCCNVSAALDEEGEGGGKGKSETFHKLTREPFATQLSTMRPLIADLLALLAETHTKPIPPASAQFLTHESFSSLIAMLGMNSLGVGTSAFIPYATALADYEDDDEAVATFLDDIYAAFHDNVGGFLDAEGSALFLKQSACNHSCVPNAECSFKSSTHRMALVAVKDIARGEEVLISYLDAPEAQSRNERWEELRENYLFLCHCELCEDQAADPDTPLIGHHDSSEDDDEDEDDENDDDDDDDE